MMMQQAMRMSTEQMNAAAYNRQLAMQSRSRVRPVVGHATPQPRPLPLHLTPAAPKVPHALGVQHGAGVRATLHPHYVSRRRNTGRDLAHHALGTLLVLGALVLMANA